MVHASAMANPQPDPYARVVHRFSTASKLDAAGNMLSWDAQTHMPAGGAWARGEQMAALTEVSADLIGSRAAADELGEAEAMASALAADERADLAEMRHKHAHASAVPKELLAAKSRASQALQAVWRRAKPENDWAAFEPGFVEVLGLTREIAQAKAEALGTTPYSALIDDYDPGVGEALIDPIFAELAAFLPALIAEVRERQAAWPAPIPFGDVPIEQQAALSHQLAVAIGHDPDHFRIDPAPHPFSVPHSPGDVRFTTRYDLENPKFAVAATLHEAGHAMYEFNLPRDFAFRPGGMARGATAHESQSLSLEKMCGRSQEFLGWLAPKMADAFGGVGDARYSPANVLEHLALARRRLHPRRGRRALLSAARDPALPAGAGADRRHARARRRAGGLERALHEDARPHAAGSRPRTAAGHPLGDGHAGLLPQLRHGLDAGRSALRAGCRRRARTILPALGRGDFGPYFAWVKPRVHERASLTSFDALVRDATGAALSADAFKRHVRKRYLEETAP